MHAHIHTYIYTLREKDKHFLFYSQKPGSFATRTIADFVAFLSHWKVVQAIKYKIRTERKASDFTAGRETLRGAGLDVLNLLLLCLFLSAGAARDEGC